MGASPRAQGLALYKELMAQKPLTPETIDRSRLYSVGEAVKIAKESATTKYDATVEVALRLGVESVTARSYALPTIARSFPTARYAALVCSRTAFIIPRS